MAEQLPMLSQIPPRNFMIQPMLPGRSSPDTLRTFLSALFRNKRLMKVTFVSVLAGAIVAIAVYGVKYEAETQIVVKHRRADQVVSTDANSRDETNSTDVPTEREINTEISILRSNDLLETVVKDLHLDEREKHLWNVFLPWRNSQWRIATAEQRLRDGLKIDEIPQSNVIHISLRSHYPELAAQILNDLDKQYMAKHLAVYRPPGVYDFFHNQTQHYQQQLQDSEKQLASYDLSKDSTDPALEKEILVRKAGEFEGTLHETESDMRQTQRQISEIQAELSKTPDRLTTQVTSGDNPQLLANLKSSLADLQTRRTDLLTKYQPSYRLVQDVNKQIAELNAQIASEGQNPVKQQSSSQNPTYLLLQSELVKANADLSGYNAKLRATEPIIDAYKQQALLIDQKAIQRTDLLRNIKTAEDSYLLYVQKQEQARISEELDKSRVLNVSVAEMAIVPSFPVYSPWLMVVAALTLALMMSIAVGFLSDYFDPTFRAPEEIEVFLGVPLLACFAKGGSPVGLGLPAIGGGTRVQSLPQDTGGAEPRLLTQQQ
jgi:uncharacterized protein involved in exopolysaccharide biosynthesis